MPRGLPRGIRFTSRIAILLARRYNAIMFDESLDFAEVMARLRRADESLGEFVSPLWPGVSLAAAWIEGHPRLFHLDGVPEEGEGYYVLAIAEERAQVFREASEEEIQRYRGYLTKSTLILLEEGLAFPATSVERLQGIIKPRPLHFAQGEPLTSVKARYDGLNLFFDGGHQGRKTSSIEDIFAGEPIFSAEEFLGLPGQQSAGEEAREALEKLHAHPELAIGYRLEAVLETGGAVLEDWTAVDGAIRLRWHDIHAEHVVTLRHPNAPITSGISLAGARTFDPATLVRLLVEHVLDAWQ